MRKPLLASRWRKLLTFGFPVEALSRDLKLLVLSNFIGAFGDGLYAYILPIFISELPTETATVQVVGIALSVLTLASALTPIPGGVLADKYDRKKVMILGWLIWIPVPLIFSFAQDVFQMIPAMFMYGFFLSGPATTAYIATSAFKGKMTQAFTSMSASWWMGYIVSPSLGGFLSEKLSMRWVFRIALVFYVAATFTLFFIKSQYPKKKQLSISELASRKPTQGKKIVLWSLFLAAAMFTFFLSRSLLPLFYQDILDAEIFHVGVFGSITFLGSAILILAMGRLGDSWGRPKAISFALTLTSISFVVLIVSGSLAVALFGAFLLGASYAIWSLVAAIVSLLSPDHARGRWISVTQTTALCAAVLGPYVGSKLYAIAPHIPLYVGAAVTPIFIILILTKFFSEKTLKCEE